MECFRIDESGYTGFDLLNRDQRFQGAAAIAIDNDDAARLIKDHFSKIQARELKFGALSRRPENHPRILGLIRDTLHNYKSVTYVCDKRFLLIMKFLDYAVETWYLERGLDFYEDGRNYAMGSLLAMTGSQIFGTVEFEGLLAAFQLATKLKTPETLHALVTAARQTNWRAFPEAMGPLAQYAAPECLSAIATPGVTTDIAIIVLQALITRMEVMTDGPYRVEHDQSKNLTTYHELLRRFIDHDREIELRQSEIASIKFPLKLTAVTQVDSKANPSIQLADVMIGATLEALNRLAGLKARGIDPDRVKELYADEQLKYMMPDIDFEEQRRFRQGTQASELIDYFAANFGTGN